MTLPGHSDTWEDRFVRMTERWERSQKKVIFWINAWALTAIYAVIATATAIYFAVVA